MKMKEEVKTCSTCPYADFLEYGPLQKRDCHCEKLKISVKKYAFYPDYNYIPEFCPMANKEITYVWADNSAAINKKEN